QDSRIVNDLGNYHCASASPSYSEGRVPSRPVSLAATQTAGVEPGPPEPARRQPRLHTQQRFALPGRSSSISTRQPRSNPMAGVEPGPPGSAPPRCPEGRSVAERFLIQFAQAGDGVVLRRLHRAALQQGLEDWLHAAALGIAAGTIAVGPDVGELAAGVPDGHRRAAGPAGPCLRQWPMRQLRQDVATTAGRTPRPGEAYALRAETPGHLVDVGLMTGVAGTFVLPDMHHLDLATAERRCHLYSGKECRPLEGALMPAIQPPPGPADRDYPDTGQQPADAPCLHLSPSIIDCGSPPASHMMALG